MTQQNIDTAVAMATGEDLCEIRRLGFSFVDLDEGNFDPEPDDLPPNIMDWDELELERTVAIVDQRDSSLRRVA